MLEVLQRASQAVKVTWKSDDQDKENEDPLPASGERTRPGVTCFMETYTGLLHFLCTKHQSPAAVCIVSRQLHSSEHASWCILVLPRDVSMFRKMGREWSLKRRWNCRYEALGGGGHWAD